MIIAIGCLEKLQYLNQNIKLWIEVGVESKNNLRYISTNQIHESIGQSLASALPAFYAFFGCDYLAAFCRKGKIRPYNLLKQDIPAQEAFAAVGEGSLVVPENARQEIERFLCKVYGQKKLSSIDEVRFQVFASKYKPKKNGAQSITDVKSMDGSAMPPCFHVLQEKINRTAFVASKWCSSTEPLEPAMSPSDSGWFFEDGKYKIKLFEGGAAPRSLVILLNDADDEKEGDECEEDEMKEESDGEDEDGDSGDDE